MQQPSSQRNHDPFEKTGILKGRKVKWLVSSRDGFEIQACLTQSHALLNTNTLFLKGIRQCQSDNRESTITSTMTVTKQ